MEDVTKRTRALDIRFGCMKVDLKWNQGDLWGEILDLGLGY